MAGFWARWRARQKASNDFVVQFQAIVRLGAEAAVELKRVFHSDPEEGLRRMVEIEHRADEAVHEIHRLVDRTFITPYDKRDIVLLAGRLDDIVDGMRTTARQVVSFRALGVTGTAPLVELADVFCTVIAKSVAKLREVVDAMPGFEHDAVRAAGRVISQYEDDGDELFVQAMRMLFPDPNQPLTVGPMAWREIYRLLENTTDCCDHAMTLLVSIARQEGS